MKNLISIIVPVYNVEEYLSKCINSIQMQTYSDIQIILVDDGSTDSSGQICDRYADNDNRICVVHQKNGGLVTARKTGISIAEGEYIGFVDGDDYITSTFYENLLGGLIHSEADFIHSGIIFERSDGSKVPFSTNYDTAVIGKHNKIELIQKYIVHNNQSDENRIPSILCSKLFKTELIKECYAHVPDTQFFGEDLLAFCRCILKCHKFFISSKTEYYYIIRENSLSHIWNVNRFWSEGSLYNELCTIWKEYDCYDWMKNYMQDYLFIHMVNCMSHVHDRGLGIIHFKVPDKERIKYNRLVIYGAGKVGKDYISQMILNTEYNVVAWTDKRFTDKMNSLCIPIDDLRELEFDVVLIAVKSESMALEIKYLLLEMNIEQNKIAWYEPESYEYIK